MPAAQMAFAVDGELAVLEAFGDADTATRFHVFSCTKALIAGVVWQLMAEGHLSPETRAIELVPVLGTEGSTPAHGRGDPRAPADPHRRVPRAARPTRLGDQRGQVEGARPLARRTSPAPTSSTTRPPRWVVAAMIEAVEGRLPAGH